MSSASRLICPAMARGSPAARRCLRSTVRWDSVEATSTLTRPLGSGTIPALMSAVDRSLLAFAPDEHVFTLDMVHNGPDDADWKDMNEACNRFAVQSGGRPVLNQTKQLD